MDGVTQTAAPNPLLAQKNATGRQDPRAEDAKARSLVPLEKSGLVETQDLQDDKKENSLSEIKENTERLRKLAAEAFKSADVDLQISFNDEANRFVYRGVDRETGEVVREYPSEEVINRISRLRQIAGILVDTKS